MTHEVRIEAFYGHHALAEQRPPKQLFERPSASFAWAPVARGCKVVKRF
jgi:hypothetical protein